MKKFQPQKLKAFRIAKGFSQRRLAKLAGVHCSTIHYMEKPTYPFQPLVIGKVAAALEMPESYFYEEESK
jgi:transcriptional regulator with XRE-family HTH domain